MLDHARPSRDARDGGRARKPRPARRLAVFAHRLFFHDRNHNRLRLWRWRRTGGQEAESARKKDQFDSARHVTLLNIDRGSNALAFQLDAATPVPCSEIQVTWV